MIDGCLEVSHLEVVVHRVYYEVRVVLSILVELLKEDCQRFLPEIIAE